MNGTNPKMEAKMNSAQFIELIYDEYVCDTLCGDVPVGRRQPFNSRQEMKDYCEYGYLNLEYDREIRRWKIHALDLRVEPLTITGARFNKPEEIPYDLFVRLCAVQVRRVRDLWKQDEINKDQRKKKAV
jgi:hypothetical protein